MWMGLFSSQLRCYLLSLLASWVKEVSEILLRYFLIQSISRIQISYGSSLGTINSGWLLKYISLP